MKLGRLEVKASRWPWMPLEPHWSYGSNAPARYGWGSVPGMGRFGGGWQYKLGVTIGGRTMTRGVVMKLAGDTTRQTSSHLGQMSPGPMKTT